MNEPRRSALDAFAASDSFMSYRRELERWLADEGDDVALKQTGDALCAAVRDSGLNPEHVLMALHTSGIGSRARLAVDDWSAQERARDRRYTQALDLLLSSCFGTRRP